MDDEDDDDDARTKNSNQHHRIVSYRLLPTTIAFPLPFVHPSIRHPESNPHVEIRRWL
jgi:hypothetical protein